MMKSVILSLAFLTATVFALSEDELSPEVLRFMTELSNEQRAQEVASLSQEEKIRRIDEIKSRAKRNPAGKRGYAINLAFYGDEEAIQQLVRDFLEDDGQSPYLLVPMQNPHIIDLVAPEFFRDEPMQISGGDVLLMPPSFRAAELAVELLANSPAFNGEVINWARSLRGLTWSERRALVRPWWKENEKFFREKNYKAVQPGPPPPRDPYAIDRPKVPAPAATVAAPASMPVSTTPIATASDTSTPSSAFLWTGAGVSVALLVGLAIFWKRRV